MLDLDLRIYQIHWGKKKKNQWFCTVCNHSVELKTQLFWIWEFTYCYKKEDRAIAGRYKDNGCPGIILSELNVLGKWQCAILYQQLNVICMLSTVIKTGEIRIISVDCININILSCFVQLQLCKILPVQGNG